MQILVMIIKGVLLYSTFFLVTISIMGLESIIDTCNIKIVILDVILILACKIVISKEEFDILSLAKYQRKISKNNE